MVSSPELNHPVELNLFTLPLTGRSLIEASAGTGKTYSLAFIYLRLLLGIGDNDYHKPLSVDQILVVTFTKATTEELRYRIRQNIHQLRIACITGSHPDEDYQKLIELITDKSTALKRLLDAEQKMDEAAIFTIHGFCQRILTAYAFESGALFEQDLVKDESSLYLQVVRDFWRQYFTPLPEDIARVVWKQWADPEALLKDIRSYLYTVLPSNIPSSKKATLEQPLSEKINQFHHNVISKIQTVKNTWLSSLSDIESIITSSGVSKRSYSKRNLPRWIEIVTDWANQPITQYEPPKELYKFSQTALESKTDDGKLVPQLSLFTQIDDFSQMSLNLRNAILFDIVAVITEQINTAKLLLAQMGFNDLLNNLNHALQGSNGSFLAEQIAAQYPVAMIDEFQDTDPIQYQIFDRIYQDRQQTGLLLIGDPKQAIYGFRGADIFTYIKAKSSVDHSFTMLTNWRSSAKMVDAVNSLFELQSEPFIFEQIPFVHMRSATKNQHKGFYIDEQEISALNCYLLPDSITTNEDYTDYAADYCAQQIANWLSTEDCFFKNGFSKNSLSKNKHDDKTKVTSSDIAILVRSSRQADIIQQKLNQRNIKSVYLSNHKSVFESVEAREVLRILQAVLMPTNEGYLRSALATQLIGASMQDIALLSDEQKNVESLIEEFKEYQAIWLNYGVLVMLRRLMNNRHIAENVLSMTDGERIITNFMHLGELLQEVSQDLDTPHALIRWLTKQINDPDPNIENHEQRLESDENLINIITIHKSKGLEYPIVFLPFIGLFQKSESVIYHNPNTYEPEYAYELSQEVKDLIDQERLAEDLRLLYVALTRSIYHCSICLSATRKNNSQELTLINSAIGHLLLNQQENNYSNLTSRLEKLAQTKVMPINLPITVSHVESVSGDLQHLTANRFTRQLDYSWRVTSYTALQQSSFHYESKKSAGVIEDILPLFDNEVLSEQSSEVSEYSDNELTVSNQTNEIVYDIHHFPKGAKVGTLLHECFERVDFQYPDSQSVALQLITKLNLDDNWLLSLQQWFETVLQSPLAKDFSLSKLSNNQRLNELQFYLPIYNSVSALQLDKLCKQYDELSKQCEPLDFLTVQGMLKGFIDMIFEWQGQYYIVDYKSNYLGESVDDYTPQALDKTMCEHRYDLQYQFYTLALHRYLKSRIPDYQYDKHFGGVYYLFVRGMTKNDFGHGIFYTKPNQQFVEKLDKLFGIN